MDADDLKNMIGEEDEDLSKQEESSTKEDQPETDAETPETLESEEEAESIQTDVEKELELLREQNRHLSELNASALDKLDKMNARMNSVDESLKNSGLVDETPEKSETEIRADKAIADVESAKLSMLHETTKLKHPDLDTVVTVEATEREFSRLAKEYGAEHGGDYADNLIKVRDFVNAKPNPYDFMYGLIKSGQESTNVENSSQPVKPKTRKAPAENVPGSLSNVQGGSPESPKGHTAFDEMNEMDILDNIKNGTFDHAGFDRSLQMRQTE